MYLFLVGEREDRRANYKKIKKVEIASENLRAAKNTWDSWDSGTAGTSGTQGHEQFAVGGGQRQPILF
jgi:hypothetical protein